MGLCSVMVPVGSMLSSGALIVFKAFVNRVGRGPVVCIGLNIFLFFFAICHNSWQGEALGVVIYIFLGLTMVCNWHTTCLRWLSKQLVYRYQTSEGDSDVDLDITSCNLFRTPCTLACFLWLFPFPPAPFSTWGYRRGGFPGTKVRYQGQQGGIVRCLQ